MPLLLLRRLPSLLWRHRTGVLAVALVAVLAFAKRQHEKIGDIQIALAVKPKVIERVEFREVVRRVAGPVRVVERVVTRPSGERVVDRTIDRAPVTTERRRDEERDHLAEPVGLPSLATRTRWFRTTLEPARRFLPRAAAGGLTFRDRLDAGISYDWRYRAFGAEVGWRF